MCTESEIVFDNDKKCAYKSCTVYVRTFFPKKSRFVGNIFTVIKNAFISVSDRFNPNERL